MELWKKIDLIKWFSLPCEPNKIFEISNYGSIRSCLPGKDFSLIPGTIRPGSSSRPEYKYFSLRIFSKAFKIPVAPCVLYAFSNCDDISLYKIIFLDNDHKNCSISNLKLELKKCNFLVSDYTKLLYKNFANERRLYKILNYILQTKTIINTVFLSKDDIMQDYCMYLYDNLHQFESRSYTSFESFCFFKAYDFISSLKFKLSKQPQMLYLSYLTSLNADRIDEGSKGWLENKAILVSEFSLNMAHGSQINY